jgi:hypothetical protein
MITAAGVEHFEEHAVRHQNLLRLTGSVEPLSASA